MSLPVASRWKSLPHAGPAISVAPMLDWTDRHCRTFHRRLSRTALLYTEMVTVGAIKHGDRDRHLAFSADEQPVALQIGGSDPADMALAARIGADYGYAEININVGCPSDRVQSGRFGACLMQEPLLVADCVAAMKAAVAVPVTVKCRVGVDDQDPEVALRALVAAVKAAGVDGVVIHARKAWLQGLSPKDNRTIPPLDYGLVHRVKAENPDLAIGINGGIATLDDARAHLAHVDHVMIGRAAYETPLILAGVDRLLGHADPAAPDPDPFAVAAAMAPYIAAHVARGGRVSNVVRHMLGLFPGYPGARAWRRILTVEGVKPGAGIEVLEAALAALRRPDGGHAAAASPPALDNSIDSRHSQPD
ncbi:MAG: tRNA dihydrouridine(20/20a) synthase DusA [Hyphomicrobiaceae bacterium]|nr:tRNA dihydrouridine(20/20a) synthase DusA [Hyphomicrobiaceae bacterium]